MVCSLKGEKERCLLATRQNLATILLPVGNPKLPLPGMVPSFWGNSQMPTHKGLKCCSLWAQNFGVSGFWSCRGPPEEEAGTTNGVPFCRSLSFTLCGYISWRVVSGRGVLQVWGWHFSFSSSFWERVSGPGLPLYPSSSFSPTSQKHGVLTSHGQLRVLLSPH